MRGLALDRKRASSEDIYVVSSFSTFFLAVIQNPEVQKTGQKVVDEAIAELGHLPDLNEYKKLPYAEAIIREVYRWGGLWPQLVSLDCRL